MQGRPQDTGSVRQPAAHRSARHTAGSAQRNGERRHVEVGRFHGSKQKSRANPMGRTAGWKAWRLTSGGAKLKIAVPAAAMPMKRASWRRHLGAPGWKPAPSTCRGKAQRMLRLNRVSAWSVPNHRNVRSRPTQPVIKGRTRRSHRLPSAIRPGRPPARPIRRGPPGLVRRLRQHARQDRLAGPHQWPLFHRVGVEHHALEVHGEVVGQEGVPTATQGRVHRQAEDEVDAEPGQGNAAELGPQQVAVGAVPTVRTSDRQPGPEHVLEHGDDPGRAVVVKEQVAVVAVIGVRVGLQVGVELGDVLRIEVESLFLHPTAGADVLVEETAVGARAERVDQFALNEPHVEPVAELEGPVVENLVEGRVGGEIGHPDGRVAEGAVKLSARAARQDAGLGRIGKRAARPVGVRRKRHGLGRQSGHPHQQAQQEGQSALHDGKMVPLNGISTGPDSQARPVPSNTTPSLPPGGANEKASPPFCHRRTAAAATVPLPQLSVSFDPLRKVRMA